MFLLSLLVFLPGVVWGRDLRQPALPDELGEGIELDLGLPWRVQPYARLSVLYTNNVLLEPSSEREEDEVFLGYYGFDISSEGQDKSIRAGYTLGSQTYVRNGGLDTFEHFWRLGGDLALGEKLTTSLNASAAQLVTPSDPQFTGRIRRWTAQGNLTVNWQQNELLGFRVEFRSEFIDFRQRELDFFDQVGWGVSTLVTITTPLNTVTGILGGGYRELRYPDHQAIAPEMGLGSAVLGIEADLPFKLEGEVRAGFEKGWVLKRNATPRNSPVPEGLIASGFLRWRPPVSDLHLTSLSLRVTHHVNFSANAPYLRVTRIAGELNQGLPLDLELFGDVSYEVQDPKGDAHHLRSISGLLGLVWRPVDWLDAGTQGGYTIRRSKDGNFEAFSVGLFVTLKI